MKYIFTILLPLFCFSQQSWKPVYFPSPVNIFGPVKKFDGKLFVGSTGTYVSQDDENFTMVEDAGLNDMVKWHSKYVGAFWSGMKHSFDGYHWIKDSLAPWGLRVIANIHDTLYAGAEDVYQSVDGGTSWNMFMDMPYNAGTMQIFAHKNRIYTLTGYGLYSNSLAGNDLQVHVPGDVNNVGSSDELIAAATGGKQIIYSADGGISWNSMPAPDDKYVTKIFSNDTAFFFVNENAVYTSALNKIELKLWKSFDFRNYAFNLIGNKMFVGAQYKFVSSEDFGSTWKELYKGILNSQYFNRLTPDENYAVWSGGSELYLTTDGINYSEVSVPDDDYNYYSGVHSVYSILFAGNGTETKYSKDRGKTWHFVDFDGEYPQFFGHKGKIYAQSNYKLYVSDTSQLSFNIFNLPNGYFLADAAATDSLLIVLAQKDTSQYLFFSDDEGASWKYNPAKNRARLKIVDRAIYLLPLPNQWNHDTTTYYTSDFGATWSSNFPGLPSPGLQDITEFNDTLYCIAYDYWLNTGTVEKTTVYRYFQSDSSWHLFNKGIENYIRYSGYSSAPEQLVCYRNNIYTTIGDKGIWAYPGGDLQFNSGIISATRERNTGLQVFPNPSSQLFNLLFAEDQRSIKVSVYDIMGNTVCYQYLKNTAFLQVDLGGKSKGIYFLVAEGDNGQITKKIILE